MSGSALSRAAEAARIQRTFKALETAKQREPMPALQPTLVPVVPLNEAAHADSLHFAAGIASACTLAQAPLTAAVPAVQVNETDLVLAAGVAMAHPLEEVAAAPRGVA